MNTILRFSSKYVRILILLIAFLFNGTRALSQEDTIVPDSTKTTFSFKDLSLPNPNSIEAKYTYDPITDRYVYSEKLGDFNVNYPIILTPKEFQDLIAKEDLKSYYKEKISTYDGKTKEAKEKQKNLIPDVYVNSGFFKAIFGGDKITFRPQGTVEVDLGVLFTKQDNPSFSPQNRTSTNFDFNQRISLSMLGKVGERLSINANYDTQSTFDFQNLIKLDYDPTIGGGEDSILQKLEIGNVSMPLNSSLITGAQSLFGVKTELQFGRTRITGVFSEQRSDPRTVTAQGGGTVDEFELFVRDYDENRHFFLAQYFRDNYDKVLKEYPFLNTNIQITRSEVWVTNRVNNTENVRNIIAVQDLGETRILGNTNVAVSAGPNAYPDNGNNGLDPTKIGGAGSHLNSAIRDIATAQNGFNISGVQEGFEYAKLENSKKLVQGQDYTIHTQLGYISLNQRLNNDEVLAVAFQFTVGGVVYQVGEFANDGVGATQVDTNSDGQVTNVSNNALILKLLKSSITSTTQPVWDLMMKNVYDTGAYQLSQEDFRLNIFYNETSPLNYIKAVDGTPFGTDFNGNPIEETTLLKLFNVDRLNFNNDPQANGDGFFDFVPGLTVIPVNGKIIFTSVEPFGRHLFNVLDNDNDNSDADNEADYNGNVFNPNQEKYVYDLMYKSTKTKALDEAEKNKFQIKGRYSSQSGGGIPIGGFNVPRGSVKVTANGRVLVEGVDYTVNYQLGRVNITDPALKASNTPIEISTENNSIFGQQTKRFMGVNVVHTFSENFVVGGTYLNLSERPITQKANLNSEPINNTIFGFNGNYSTEVPFFTRLVNKLPNMDTDAKSNLSIRGEIAYLLPGAPSATNFNGEATSYIDDFEGAKNGIDLRSAQSWSLSSRPLNINNTTAFDGIGIENGYGRALLNWYTIDPIFYTSSRPGGLSDDDVSGFYNSRVFINELFPQQGIATGQNTTLNTLDLTYYPEERGPYNFEPGGEDNVLDAPANSWAGITRQITSTNFEQANVEYIEFWLQDPFQGVNQNNSGGELVLNLGNISEDVLSDGRKQYENGLPKNGDISLLSPTDFQSIIPQNQSLIYAFDSQGDERANQDVGLDGYSDANEAAKFPAAYSALADPAADNYDYYINADGNILERYKKYNGLEGNSPDSFSDTNRGATTLPDVEDINRDNTMNTIDSYFEYKLPISKTSLNVTNNEYVVDSKVATRTLPDGSDISVNWYQFRIPVLGDNAVAVNGITDLRSIRFVRLYLNKFQNPTTFRFGTLDLVRSDWRRYLRDLTNSSLDNPVGDFTVGTVSTQINDGDYSSPPGVVPEQLNNNNTIINQNEQALVVGVCDLDGLKSQAVFKNIDVDMRQYKKLRMFMHAEEENLSGLRDEELVGFIRMGNDLTENYYQIEVPLKVSGLNERTAEGLWPAVNEINLELKLLQAIKSIGISKGNLSSGTTNFYDVIGGSPVEITGTEFEGYKSGQQRIGIKGNPSFGAIRTLMVGVKNTTRNKVCGNVWFNELRLSEMENNGGYAAILNVDTNLADFAKLSGTGRLNSSGFGSIDQGPNERSREDVRQFNVVTNVNLGKLLPKKWGVQLPFNYGVGEELITPKFDQQYKDIELETRLENATSENEKEQIRTNSENFTKRKSINFIGVKKNRTGDSKPRFYDVENLTFNYSYNKVEHRDFEIEKSLDQKLRTGVSYAYTFKPVSVEPFKKADSLFTGKYWKALKDFNINLMPSSFSVTTDMNRQFNRQRFRDLELGAGNIRLEDLFKRNYTFDANYTINWNLTKSLQLNFTAANNNIVRNYFKNDIIVNGEQDPTKDIWDGILDFGDPNRQHQSLGVNYELPFSKIPFLSFLRSSYNYTGEFQWQKGSDLFDSVLANNGQTYDLGNAISNSNTHSLATTMNMKKLYKYLGIKKAKLNRRGKAVQTRSKAKPKRKDKNGKVIKQKKKKQKGSRLGNFGIGLLTSIKQIQFNYSENNGTYLPGYLNTPGFIGTLKPTIGYTFGSQADIRDEAARRGWLTQFPTFNQQYTVNQTRNIDFTAALEPIKHLKVDLIGRRLLAKNYSENFIVKDINNDNDLEYQSLTPNESGNYSISAFTLGTAFSKSDERVSEPFNKFKSNRIVAARRLALRNGVDLSNPDNIDSEGYPKGFGKTNQAVLLPAFLSAYSAEDINKSPLDAIRDVPLPNWDVKYSGLMKLKWFKKRFKRFSLSHGYRSTYTINQFRNNLDYNKIDYSLDYDSQPKDNLDQAGNFKNERLYSNVNIAEMFTPLIRVDLEMKNSVKILTELKKDRMLSLSFDNNLLTEIQGNEVILGLGYKLKNLSFKTKVGGRSKKIVSDLNMRADVSVRENKTIIRYLDLDNTQITNGQTIWGVKFNADYNFSRSLTGLFYFNYSFSEYAISTAFPQTTIRSGFTIKYNLGN